MSPFNGDKWSNQAQLFWTGAKPGDTLALDLPEFTGKVNLELVLTTAGDYGIVQLSLDDQPLGPPIDLYSNGVLTTGVLSFPNVTVKGNNHKLNVQIVGTNRKAKKSHLFAIDYLQIEKPDGSFVTE